MQTFLSIFVVVSMLTQMMLVTLPPGNHHLPLARQPAHQPAIPKKQPIDDPCLVVAYATYLPLIMNNSRGGGSPFIQPALIESTAGLQGRVLDANNAAQGIETPLTGVTICNLETGKSTRTDANGNFLLTELPAGELHIEYMAAPPYPSIVMPLIGPKWS